MASKPAHTTSRRNASSRKAAPASRATRPVPAKPRSGSSNSSRAAKPGASRTAGSRAPRAVGTATRRVETAPAAWRRPFGDQRQDVLGVILILVGVLTGLGTYADAAGPVGAALRAAGLGLFGLVGYGVPVGLLWFGLRVVIGRERPDYMRMAIGSGLVAMGGLIALHLAVGSPAPADGMAAVWDGGGLIGWALATPLVAAASQWGAIAVLVALIVLGLLIGTNTPFSEVFAAIRGFVTFTPSEATTTGSEPETVTDRVDGFVETDGSFRDGRVTPLPADDDELTQFLGERQSRPARATLPQIDEDPAPSTEDDRSDLRPTFVVDTDNVAASTGPQKAAKVSPVTSWEDYELPPLDLLPKGRAAGNDSERTIRAQMEALQETFHQFGVDATVARWSRGPTVTRFEIELGPGVQVKKVANMGDDIAYALAAPDVRIVAPIPGKSAIGVEVPNRKRDLITLGDVLRSDDARSDPHPLTVALGVDIAGLPALVNLTTMPHLLVSGATGSGKSVTLNGMISSVIMRARPDEVRMILIDPKRVELNAYEGAPHLLSPVVTDPRRATDAVQWCVKEMERRYEILAQEGFRNLDGYNEAVAQGRVKSRLGPEGESIDPDAMPYILLVIDELADLMLVAPRDVEDAICRIAQMARAVGIHMIIATQRPSVDVITGLIKANIPSRLALAVASQIDSRTILDANGAEKLVGKGDMLFLPASQGKPSRLQGCWVTEDEVANVVAFCKAQRQAQFDETVLKEGADAERVDAQRSGDDNSDEALLRRAARQVVESGLGSTSMLQRKLRIGFARAGRLMDELEELGVVGPNEGSKAREVLWQPDQLEEAFSSGRM